MKLIGLAFSCLLFITVAASADDTATFNGMLALAKKGDAEAQYHVGMMYNNGIGTGQDSNKAFGWFEKSAAANDPLGAYKLGCYYANQFPGVVEPDSEAALTYKLIAAKAGYSLAQHDVAVIYSRRGDAEEAVKWLQLAGDQGFDMSLYGLSSSYYDGRGVPQDRALALAYYELSLARSTTELNDKHKAILDELIAKLSNAELDRAQKFVAGWKPQPTALTVEAGEGMSAAEEHLQKAAHN